MRLISLLLFLTILFAADVYAAESVSGRNVCYSDSVVTSRVDSLAQGMDDIELGEVIATAEGNNRDAVTETVVVTDEMRRGNNSAISMLNKVPGVTVNYFDESIRVGKDRDVKIIVDGREMNESFIKSINPQRIYKIEIQRYPPGRFSDCPVVINLILKRFYVGWDASVQGLGYVSLRNRNSRLGQGTVGGTVTVNKWNIYAQLSALGKTQYESTAFTTEIGDDYIETSSLLDRHNPNNRLSSSRENLFAGVDYRFNENHLLSIQFSGNIASNKNSVSDNITSYAGDVMQEFARQSRQQYLFHEYSAGLFYRGKINDRFTLNSQFNYNYFSTHDRQSYTEGQLLPVLTLTDGRKNYYDWDIDGAWSVSRNLTLRLVNTLTSRSYDSRQRDGSDGYKSVEIRNLANLNAMWKPRREISLYGGLKLLTVNENLKTLHRDRTTTSIMPFARFYWNIKGDFSLSLNYFNDIEYPVLDRLLPQKMALSPYLYTSGNPLLKSRVMNYGEIEIGYKNILKLNYMLKFSDRDISDFYEVMDNGAVLRTFTNANYRHSYLGLSSEFTLFGQWNWSLTASMQWYKRYSGIYSSTGHTEHIDISTYYVFKPLQLMIVGSYMLRHDKLPLLQGREYNQEEQLAIGLMRSFWNSRLSVALQGTLPVSAISKKRWTRIDIPGYHTQSWTDDRVNQVLVMLNIRLAIGNGNSRSRENLIRTEKEKDI